MSTRRIFQWSLCAAALLAAQHARAQCSFTLHGMPDFDQKRQQNFAAIPPLFGLPGNGSMYCVPTSWTNITGFIANHGYPNAMGGTGNWGSQSEYARVTGILTEMGSDMDTDPANGTNSGDCLDGIQQYLEDHHVSLPCIIYEYTFSKSWVPNPKFMHSWLSHGALCCLGLGHYQQTDGSCWVRMGGHMVTLVETDHVCSSSSPTIGVRNPSTDDSKFVQSGFVTTMMPLVRDIQCFDANDEHQQGIWRESGDTGTSRSYIDSIYLLLPLAFISIDSDGLHYHLTVPNTVWSGLPQNTTIADPAPTPLSFVLPDPTYGTHLLISRSTPGTVPTPAHLWRHDLADDSNTLLMNLPGDPTAAAFDRAGNLLVAAPGQLLKIDALMDTPSITAQSAIPFNFDALALNDSTDQILGLNAATHQFALLPAVQSPPQTFALPTAITLIGEPSVAVNPLDGGIWITSAGAPAIYRLVPPTPLAPPQVAEMIPFIANVNARGLQFTDNGRLCYSANSIIQVLYKDPTSGQWIPDAQSPLRGLAAPGRFSIPRTRTNFDPAIHTGPAFYNLTDPIVLGTEVADCPPDFDADNELTINDIFAFLSAWFDPTSPTPPGHHADFDGNGAVDVTDIFTFLTAWFTGC